MTKAAPKSPRPVIHVSLDSIKTAMRADSAHCMIADSIAAQIPDARNVSVDLATIRWSDPAKGVRYIYLTPRNAQELLIAFDQGWDDLLQPIHFELRNAQVVKIQRRVVDANGIRKRATLGKTELKRAQNQGTGGSMIRTGGKPPPLGPLTNSGYARLGRRRAFGLKSLRTVFQERQA